MPTESEPRFARAVLAFLVLPGVVAILVPLAWVHVTSHTTLVHPVGLLPLLLGLAALGWCVRDFYVAGKGTLAPWSPPTRLVVVGFYRWSRNPMYVAVTTMLLGWAAAFGSWGLLAYAAVVAVIFHVRVVLGEEPWLARTFGREWEAYKAKVPRWLW